MCTCARTAIFDVPLSAVYCFNNPYISEEFCHFHPKKKRILYFFFLINKSILRCVCAPLPAHLVLLRILRVG